MEPVQAKGPTELNTCPLHRQNPALFEDLVAAYGEVIELAVRATVSGTDRHVFAKIRTLARRAGDHDAVPQDLIAVHLSALALLVKTRPQTMVRACIRQSRLLLVKMVGELALYYRDRTTVPT